MDRFMDDADPQKKAQSRLIEDELNSLRERLSTLQRGKVGASLSLAVACLSLCLEWIVPGRVGSHARIFAADTL